MDSFCIEIKEILKHEVEPHLYNMWIKPLSFFKDREKIIVECCNSFFRRRIESDYFKLLESVLHEKCGYKNIPVEIKVSQNSFGKKSCCLNEESFEVKNKKKSSCAVFDQTFCEGQMELPVFRSHNNLLRQFKKNFTLENFVVGKNSEFAYSASLALVSGSGHPYNSVFIHADTGLGKSHLCQAVGSYILNKGKEHRDVYYISAEDFTAEMVYWLKQGELEKFKEKYRKHCDVLLLDDIQNIESKSRTQQELISILDYLMDADKKVIFSGSLSPQSIPKIKEQLRSRLSAGLFSVIDKPDFKTRRNIVIKKASLGGYNFSDDIIDYLASELTDNIRQLESGVTTLGEKIKLLDVPVSLELAREIISDLVERNSSINIESIKKLVAFNFGIPTESLCSKSRKKVNVTSRQIAMYLIRKYTEQPFDFIGKSFNRSHGTVIHSIKIVEKGIKCKDSTFSKVKFLSDKLESGDF